MVADDRGAGGPEQIDRLECEASKIVKRDYRAETHVTSSPPPSTFSFSSRLSPCLTLLNSGLSTLSPGPYCAGELLP